MADGLHVITGALGYTSMAVAERLLATGARLQTEQLAKPPSIHSPTPSTDK